MGARPTSRSCNPCVACCKPFPVPEVDKYDASWCQYCTINKGCTIYPNRPYECQVFECIWLSGKGEESDRPDLLKVMMEISDFEIDGRECDILHLWEMEEGAFDQSRVRQIIESAKDQGLIVVFHHPFSADDGYKGYKHTAQVSPRLFTEAESSRITEMATRGLL